MATTFYDAAPPVYAYHGVGRPLVEPSHTYSSLATLDKNQDLLWDQLEEFYNANQDIIERSTATSLIMKSDAADEKSKFMQFATDTFVETASIILDGLVALGNVHPILGIAIFAFHGVITLDLTRRDNNHKVLAVIQEMQNMMCAMFQLRKLRYVHSSEIQRDQERERLQKLIKVIADEIKKCGSDLNYYSNRKLVSKLVNAKGYERRFAEHVKTFSLRRSELQMTMSSYIAAGVDAANIAIAEVGDQVTVMNHKLDDITAMFRKLDTARERDCRDFIETKGGPDKCIATDDLLIQLLSKSSDGSDIEESKTSRGARTLMDRARTELRREISEDLQQTLTTNQLRFEKQLIVQNNNLKLVLDRLEDQSRNMKENDKRFDQIMNTSIMILEEGKLIKKAVMTNASIKLKDPELQVIWDEMGLKRSVKAKQFVLTFRDYLMAEHSPMNSPHPQTARFEPEPRSLLLSASPKLQVNTTQRRLRIDEDTAWVLKHIDVTHVQPIVEAIDEDGSGFISVKEANNFALARPKGWSLLNWIAYWAAGWHLNITDYRRKIYTSLRKMHEMVPSLRAVNQKLAYIYLSDYSINRIEAILRSLRPFPSDAPRDPKLVEVATSMSTLQDERLKANLKEMSYLIQTPADVTLIAGTERLETWILPLLHLVLERHLAIFKVAQTKVLDKRELADHSVSLYLIISALDNRIARLKDIFRQVHRDSASQFENFAYGMFHASYNYKTEPIKNTILTFGDMTDDEEDTAASEDEPNVSVLTKGMGPLLEDIDLNLKMAIAPPDHQQTHPIEGLWVCTFEESNATYSPVIFLNIPPVIDNQVSAIGVESINSVTVVGSIEDAENEEGRTSINFKVTFDLYLDRRIKGWYDHQRDVISGKWVIENEEGEFPSDDNDDDCSYRNGAFLMTRRPPHAFRFRRLLDQPESSDTRSLARRRWAFALHSVLCQVQEWQCSSWKLIRSRIVERNTWVDLSIRDMLPGLLKVTRGFLPPGRVAEWERLRTHIHPATLVFYEKIAKYLFDRSWYHVGIFICDTCHQRIVFSRYFCIICVEEGLDNQFDFCAEHQCINSSDIMDSLDFVHSVSHTLLRANRRVLPAEMPKLISQSTLRSERIKRAFRQREAKTLGISSSTRLTDRGIRLEKAEQHVENELQGKTPATMLVCATCKKDLTFPCWACAICTLDTLFCLDCELLQSQVQSESSTSEKHSSDHLLLRLHDSSEDKQIRLKSSNKQLEHLEARINGSTRQGLLALEDKINNRLETVESVVKNVVKDLGQDMAIFSPFLSPPNHAGQLEEPSKTEDTDLPPKLDLRPHDRITTLEERLEARFNNLEAKMEAILSILTPKECID